MVGSAPVVSVYKVPACLLARAEYQKMLFVWGSSDSGSLLGMMNGAGMVVCVYSSSVSLSENSVPNSVTFMRVTFFWCSLFLIWGVSFVLLAWLGMVLDILE